MFRPAYRDSGLNAFRATAYDNAAHGQERRRS
jgi:hypothetical protein